MKKIIGIVGFAGSGKSTVGEYLKQNLGFEQLSFAESLKDAVSSIFGWPRHMLEGDTPESREFREQKDEWWSKKLNRDVTPRWALQYMGTDVIRDGLDDNIWIFSVERKLSQTDKSIVITDVRFPNEIQMIHKLGGKILRIVRGAEPIWYKTALMANKGSKSAKAELEELGVHASEWSWIGEYDKEIHNNYSVSALFKSVEAWLNESLP